MASGSERASGRRMGITTRHPMEGCGRDGRLPCQMEISQASHGRREPGAAARALQRVRGGPGAARGAGARGRRLGRRPPARHRRAGRHAPRRSTTPSAPSATSRSCARTTATATAIDEVELDPSWHWCLRQAIEREIHSLPWRDPQPGAHAVRAALFFVWSQVNSGVMCPVSMTYSADSRAARGAGAGGRVGAAGHEAELRRRRAGGHGDDREAGRLGRAREHHPRHSQRRRAGRSPATSGSAPIPPATPSSRSRRRRRACPAS